MFSKIKRKTTCKFKKLALTINGEDVDLASFVFDYDKHYTAHKDGLELTSDTPHS